MNLDGGIDQYRFGFERHGSGEAPHGRKVRFLNKNGWSHDPVNARKYMEEGQILTVEEVYVGSSSSTVSFVEIPGKEFNTVMFEDLEGTDNEDDF